MKAIHQAQKLYIEYQINKTFLSDSKKSEMKNDIQRFITIAIKETPSNDLFQNVWLLEKLKLALRQIAIENSDVMLVERAFRGLEKYFLLIVQQPWKAEFREIKMYGGFYKTRIQAVIPDCEQIFQRAGYMVLPDNYTMIYKDPMNKTFLLHLALDCRVGQMECKAIAEHFSRIKGLPMTLNDVISNFLHDERSRDKIVRKGFHEKYGLFDDISNYVVPLPIPERKPIINATNIRQNVTLENEPFRANDHHKFEMNAGMAFPIRPSQWLSDPKLPVLRKSSLLSAADVIHESLSYIDNINDETIPELPQGTCEDHMRETLKLVNLQDIPRQPVSEDWRWDSKNISVQNPSNFSVTPPYSVSSSNSGNVVMQRNVKPGSFIDEGIEQDISKSFSLGSKFGSINSQQAPPNKLSQISYDPGYHPGNPDSMYSQQSASLMHNHYPTIYHAPNISDASPSVYNRKMTLSRQNALPHQMPSSAMKATQNTEETSLYSQFQVPTFPNTISKSMTASTQIQSEANIAQPTLSAPGYLAFPPTFQMDPFLRNERPTICKASSLKTGENNTPLSQQIAAARMVRSMDMTFWECPSCSKLNTSLNTICPVCLQSYMGPDVNHTGTSRTQAML